MTEFDPKSHNFIDILLLNIISAMSLTNGL